MSFLKKNKRTVWWLLPVALLGGWLILRWLVVMMSPRPDNLGVQNGRLAECPASPNCVSSYAVDELHGMEAIPLAEDAAATQSHLLAVIQDQPRTRIISNEPGYLHVEFRSLGWGFIDDVEFYVDEAAGLLHFRSASRLGYGDAEVNRARMTHIRQLLSEG